MAELDARTKPKSESKEEEAAARAAMEATAMGFVPQGLQLMNEPAYGTYATADVYTAGVAAPAAYMSAMPTYGGMGGMGGMAPGYGGAGGMPYPGMPGQPY